MKKAKYFLLLLAIVVLVCGVVACNNSETPDEKTPNDRTIPVNAVVDSESGLIFESRTVKKVNDSTGEFEDVEYYVVFGFNNEVADVVVPAEYNGIAVESILDGAFNNSSKLESVTIEEGISSIGERAFFNCQNLKNVTIPYSVQEIGDMAFELCNNVEKFSVLEKEIGGRLRSSKYSGDENGLYGPAYFDGYSGSLGNKLIKGTKSGVVSGVFIIGEGAFRGFNLDSEGKQINEKCDITIPDSVLTIEPRAFLSSGITSVTIEDGDFTGIALYELGLVRTISDYAFMGCTYLENVEIGEYVGKIGTSAFENCTLTSIDIPANVKEIGNMAFYGCKKMAEINYGAKDCSVGDAVFGCCGEEIEDEKANGLIINVSDDVKSFGNAFRDCNAPSSISIGSGVEEIKSSAFDGCDVRTITVSEDNENYMAYGNVLYEKKDKNIVFVSQYAEGALVLPSGIETIPEEAFEGRNITKVTIPESVVTIGKNAFAKCENLKEIVFEGNEKGKESSLSEIGFGAFSYCTQLTNVEIPDCGKVGNYAFYCCTSLKNATICGEIGYYAFAECSALEDAYLVTTKIETRAFSSCANLKKIEIECNGLAIGEYAFSDCIALSGIRCAGISKNDWEGVSLDANWNANTGDYKLYLKDATLGKE